MSTEEDHVIDKQPQTTTSDDNSGSNKPRMFMQTTEHGQQVEQPLPGFKLLDRLNKLEVVQRLDTLEGLLVKTICVLPPLSLS